MTFYRINAIMIMQVKFYEKARGKRPVADFLDKLPADDAAKIAACLSNVEALGFDSPRVEFRQIKSSLWEIKIKTFRSGYRIFYVCIQDNIMVLLHAYKKQSKKAPKKHIDIAEKRMMEVLEYESSYTH